MEKLCLPLVFLFVQGVMADLRISQQPQEPFSGRLEGYVSGRYCGQNPGTEEEPYGCGTANPREFARDRCQCLVKKLPLNCLSPGIWPGYYVNSNGSQCSMGGGGGGSKGAKMHHKWQEPSTFDYYGLGKFQTPGKPYTETYMKFEAVGTGQKKQNYDQFLRSNIDNEQDNRDFLRDDGHDHLPFRSWNSEIRAVGDYNRLGANNKNLWATVEPGDSRVVPLHWNNPHAAELEVNIWIQQHSAGNPIVVPIRKPTCSGEGHFSSVIKFTIPEDFGDLGFKIPGFNGCNEDSKPMCVLQIYAHSVESRQYSSAFPIVIPGNNKNKPATRRRRRAKSIEASSIEAVRKDPWLDLTHLRELCLPSNDPKAIIKKAVPRWARLVSDVYNHAYQNSDFSPYSGQQHESISQNLQASAINKMVTGNRGELGRLILPREARNRIAQLQVLEDRIYKNYEALADKIIMKVGNEMKTTAFFDTAQNGEGIVEGPRASDGNLRVVTAHCFRCAETGSLYTPRLNTNTYIPSFQLPQNFIAQARSSLPKKYGDLISPTGHVRIYVQSLLDLLPFFAASHPYGIIYQQAMIKNTLLTKPDATKFRKIDPTREGPPGYPDGYPDGGRYASVSAKAEFATTLGCPMSCLRNGISVQGDAKPLYHDGAKSKSIPWPRGTKVTGECSGCKAFFNGFPHDSSFQPALTSLAASIVKEGLPKGMGDITPYADPDGTPRMGRPQGLKEIAPTMPPGAPVQPDWKNVTTGPPTSAPTKAPAPKLPVDPPSSGGCAKLSACIRRCPEDPASFKECVGMCQSAGESDARPTRRRRRRRGSRRRNRKVSLQELFDHVAAQHKLS